VLQLLKRYRELILVAVLLLVPLGVFFAHAKKPDEQSRLDRIVLWVTSPIEKAVGWTVRGALSLWDGYVALRGSHADAQRLALQNRDLLLERQELLLAKEQNARLRELLGMVETSPGRTFVAAHVIGVRLAPAGLQVLTIDRGSDDGLARMMPVVVPAGVVGRVHAVSPGSADVLLFVDRFSSVAVRVDRTRARANVRGTGTPGGARLEYALRTEDMIEGDLLVTSGTDGVFPRGLPVGRVTALRKQGQGLFQEGAVVPAVDVTRIEEVLVMTSSEVSPGVRPAALAPEAP
jgi:rod shape-determining protein MreC